ncbi:histone acetyltransferase subunit NuA4-domain-containing protein [Pseudomassariella vexata]|uniref:Chromatin modification-related protein EAF6 n=1 Tax=Pseudomassariella vexata TaxID=1141098 RepID=A0A1Y2DSA6_9PEZI|nr:histone acetyltransferase subunit NuA4-domain-containing protein [Pseudomassariella vexata]ORY62147.1 histone acetyltransferase subunit NuA4-domain-containing protein [Pseudomassariella vexata]
MPLGVSVNRPQVTQGHKPRLVVTIRELHGGHPVFARASCTGRKLLFTTKEAPQPRPASASPSPSPTHEPPLPTIEETQENLKRQLKRPPAPGQQAHRLRVGRKAAPQPEPQGIPNAQSCVILADPSQHLSFRDCAEAFLATESESPRYIFGFDTRAPPEEKVKVQADLLEEGRDCDMLKLDDDLTPLELEGIFKYLEREEQMERWIDESEEAETGPPRHDYPQFVLLRDIHGEWPSHLDEIKLGLQDLQNKGSHGKSQAGLSHPLLGYLPPEDFHLQYSTLRKRRHPDGRRRVQVRARVPRPGEFAGREEYVPQRILRFLLPAAFKAVALPNPPAWTRTVVQGSYWLEGFDMAENAPPAASGNGESVDRAKEMPEYEKEKQKVREAIAQKNHLVRNLALVEARITDLEGKYIESTPSGNILTGFDNYTKGITGAAAQRRKAGTAEQNRVFSRSSISYNQDAATPASGATTPGAPTPLSATFANKDKDSGPANAPTPGSVTDKKGGASKKRKEKEKATTNEDSETDSREIKKIRTNFGATRK